MKKIFATLLFVSFIFLSTTPAFAGRKGHVPLRYQSSPRYLKHAGYTTHKELNPYERNYYINTSPNYRTGTGPNYRTASNANYRMKIGANYRTTAGANYRSGTHSNYRTATNLNYSKGWR